MEKIRYKSVDGYQLSVPVTLSFITHILLDYTFRLITKPLQSPRYIIIFINEFIYKPLKICLKSIPVEHLLFINHHICDVEVDFLSVTDFWAVI